MLIVDGTAFTHCLCSSSKTIIGIKSVFHTKFPNLFSVQCSTVPKTFGLVWIFFKSFGILRMVR